MPVKLLLLTIILLMISAIDWKWMIIPNSLTVAVALIAVWSCASEELPNMAERAAGCFQISVPMILLNCAVKNCFGFGDVKLCMAAGFLLGAKGILLTMFIAVLTGGCYAVALLIKDKRNRSRRIPFGPFLALGIWISYVFGSGIIDWYTGVLKGGW